MLDLLKSKDTPYNSTPGVGMRQGGGIETEAGLEMEEKNPNKPVPQKADINNNGEIEEWEKARHEAIQETVKKTEMAMGGMMGMMADPFAPFQVTVDIDEESGNEVPAGSKEEEVRDDIPAMLSEGEYVVPADVVRYHGLKTFEQLRCEAKEALGLMAMHDRISFVDDETKEPVEYDDDEIEEEDKPEVEEAEVEVVEAAEGTDVQPVPDTTFYQLQYKTDPVTGQVRIVYVDPLTGQEIRREEYEEERASRFAPQRLLEREVFAPAREAVEQEEEEEPVIPEIVEEVTGGDGGGPDEPDTGLGPDFGLTQDDIDTALSQANVGYTGPKTTTVPGAVTALGMVTGIPVNAIAKGVDAVNNAFARNSALGAVRAGENLGVSPTGEYGGWRSNMSNSMTAAVAQTENEARDVVSGKTGLQGSSFGTMAEAEAVAKHGYMSDENIEAIEASFAATRAASNAAEAARGEIGPEGTDPGDVGTAGNDTEGTDAGDVGTDDSGGVGPDGTDAGDAGGFNKGGMPARKNTPLVKMMKY